jgi:CelD/BcsL family acetyltransferase involved in cellulose biosynthesis
MLAWWRQIAGRQPALRIVAARDRGELVGIVPLQTQGAHDSYRLLADDLGTTVTPLSRLGREWEVARAAAGLLGSELHPDLIELGPVPAFSPWAAALREGWPGLVRPLAWRRNLSPFPTLDLEGRSFDEWLGQRSSRFRANVRRYRRLFAEAGGTYRRATADTIAADVRTFVELHANRFEQRFPSRLLALGDRLTSFLEDVAGALLPDERFRLLVLELDGTPICADLWLAAGGEVTGFNIGWDRRYGHLSPPRLAFLQTLEDACERGACRVNFGLGNVQYKQAYANAEDAVSWEVLLPGSRNLVRLLPKALSGIAGARLRQTAKRRLTEEQVSRLRELRSAAVRRRGLLGASRTGARAAPPPHDRARGEHKDRDIRSDAEAADSPAQDAGDHDHVHGSEKHPAGVASGTEEAHHGQDQ